MNNSGGEFAGYAMSWLQGKQATRTRHRVAFVESEVDAEMFAVSEFGSRFDLVFAPNAAQRPTDGATIAGYTGELADGGEINLSEGLVIQFQNYAAAEFLSFPGPTVLVPVVETDRLAFTSHVLAARERGIFPEVLSDPQVLIADRFAWLGCSVSAIEPDFVYLEASGVVSTSPWGVRLGRVIDGQLVNEESAASDLYVPAGASHFLQSVEALRYATARGITGLSVSGYGGFINDGLAIQSGDHIMDGPAVLLFNDDHWLLHVSDSHKTYALTEDLAVLTELVFLFGDSALEHADATRVLAALSPAQREFALSETRAFLSPRLNATKSGVVSA